MLYRLFGLSVVCFGTFLSAPILAEDLPCQSCHADAANSFSDSHHGQVLDGSEALSCASCHGDGASHLAAPSAPGSILKFRDESAAEQNAACANCHTPQAAVSANPHSVAEIACTGCHAVHTDRAQDSSVTARPSHVNLDLGSWTCVSCHENTLTQFQFNESHRLMEGAISCISCHDPHEPESGMKLGGIDDQCSACHAEKSGPFVFEHGAQKVEGCVACHAPHGSPNRHLLTFQSNGELCYSCHATVPQFHLGFSQAAPARFDAQTVCTNCHESIHGSNLDPNFLR
jgi:DmsE family decaheme c-type cytochrome